MFNYFSNPGFGRGLFNPMIMDNPLLLEVTKSLTWKQQENLLVAGYDPQIEAHYWTDENGEHLVFDNEIPQPE